MTTRPTRHVQPATVWSFELGDGRTASLIPDLHVPARFELLVGDRDVYPALTSAEVDAKLAELATN